METKTSIRSQGQCYVITVSCRSWLLGFGSLDLVNDALNSSHEGHLDRRVSRGGMCFRHAMSTAAPTRRNSRNRICPMRDSLFSHQLKGFRSQELQVEVWKNS